MSPLCINAPVYVHDPSRRGCIYRRGFVWSINRSGPQLLYAVRLSGQILEGMIREQLLTPQEMAERRAWGR